jgi:acyl-CoA hydrolase
MAKIISLDEALSLIKDGDHIVAGMAAAEGKVIFENLHTIAPRITQVTIDNCLPVSSYPFIADEKYKDQFTINSWFFSGDLRKAFAHGNIHFIPNHLHFAGVKRLQFKTPDLYIGNATPPDKHGYVSLSLGNVYEKRMIQAAQTVILEINPNLPRTFGDMDVHVSEIDYMVEVDYPAPTLPDTAPTEKDLAIGRHIAEYIQDGDTLQLGIGAIPNAVAHALKTKKDLGVHTEMLTTGFMKLYQAGVITNKKKTLHPGKMVAAFALGTQELYDFLDDNPGVLMMDGFYVNDPNVIAKNDNQVSINTTLQVDLAGQCASESIGSRQYSGTGGQSDTATGAQKAKNGRSFIALYSTALITTETDQKVEVSKIVPQLIQGAFISLSRNDVDHVVTEYGVAKLRGTALDERARRLIAIAHPKFRDELTKAAQDLGFF